MEEEEVIWWHGVAAHGMSLFCALFWFWCICVPPRRAAWRERESRRDERERESMLCGECCRNPAVARRRSKTRRVSDRTQGAMRKIFLLCPGAHEHQRADLQVRSLDLQMQQRRLEEEEIYKRENAALLKRQAKERKIAAP